MAGRRARRRGVPAARAGRAGPVPAVRRAVAVLPAIAMPAIALSAVILLAFVPPAGVGATEPAAGEATVAAPGEPAAVRPLRIGVLDVERVRRTAQAVKAIHTQLSGYVDAYRSETQKEEQEIRAAQEELARKRPALPPEGYAEERRKLEEQLVGAQGRVQARRQALERVSAEAMQQVQDVLGRIVADVAGEQQLTLIVRKDQVVFMATDLEITDQVLQRLDRQLPSVRISDPGR